MKKKHEPTTLAAALAAAMKDLGINARLKEYDVVNLWPSIVGEQIARVATAESIAHGKLIVRVSRATWRNELVFLKAELITRINTAVGQEIVKDIIFR
jgi:predicted nucleic acid-binding Zn ribbon protein